MMKNCPLLEFDKDPDAVLRPDHEQLGLDLPEKCVLAFVPEAVIADFARSHGGKVVGAFETFAQNNPIYEVCWEGERICLCQACLGAPAAVQLLDWLIGYGVRTILSTGSCGVLTDLPENAFLLPVKALRDEGTSCHYAPMDRWIDLDPEILAAWEQTLRERELPCQKVRTWTTDGFFRETRAKVRERKAEGCAVVEMECAALAACAAFRQVRWGMLLFTADSLAAPDHHDQRDWGRSAHTAALELCFETASRL